MVLSLRSRGGFKEEIRLDPTTEFRTRCTLSNNKVCNVIINPKIPNWASNELVEKLSLPLLEHPQPYWIHGLHEDEDFLVSKQVNVSFSFAKKYFDSVLCDVLHMDLCHLVLGKEWFARREAYLDEEQRVCCLHDGRMRIKLVALNQEKGEDKNSAEISQEENKPYKSEVPQQVEPAETRAHCLVQETNAAERNKHGVVPAQHHKSAMDLKLVVSQELTNDENSSCTTQERCGDSTDAETNPSYIDAAVHPDMDHSNQEPPCLAVPHQGSLLLDANESLIEISLHDLLQDLLAHEESPSFNSLAENKILVGALIDLLQVELCSAAKPPHLALDLMEEMIDSLLEPSAPKLIKKRNTFRRSSMHEYSVWRTLQDGRYRIYHVNGD